MIRYTVLFLFIFLPGISLANLESEFTFIGQNAETLNLEKKVNINVAQTVEVPSTCERKVPVGEREICRDVTRYRQSCSWVPASERCRTERERVCRDVTRYRDECSHRPSRRVCTDRPSRRVCSTQPTRRVCTNRPDGRRHCTTVGGEQVCRNVPGGQDCRTIPGERTCRRVAYRDRDCNYIPRQRCETIPGRNSCKDIPYQQRVCEMVTQYETESYACTREETVNQTVEKIVKAQINIEIITNGYIEEFPVSVSVKELNNDFDSFSIDIKLLKQPKVLVVVKKKEIQISEITKNEIILSGDVTLEILSQEIFSESLPKSIVKAGIEKSSNMMTLVFDNGILSKGEIELTITHNASTSREKTLVKMNESYPGEKISLPYNSSRSTLLIDLNGSIKNRLKKKNMTFSLLIKPEINLEGEILNEKKPEMIKLFKGENVHLQ